MTVHRIKKTIGEILSNESPPWVEPTDLVAKAADLMLSSHAGCVLVVEGGRLTGIFTERDYLNRVAAESLDPQSTPVSHVMTRSPEALRRGDCVTYAINKMVVGGFRSVPMVDAGGSPVGLLRIRDVVDHLAEVFGEAASPEPDDPGLSGAWIDIGGGG